MEDFDLRDILLEATAEVQEIVREVLDELREPAEKAQALTAWAQMSDEMKELYAQARPAEVAELMKAMDGRSKRYG